MGFCPVFFFGCTYNRVPQAVLHVLSLEYMPNTPSLYKPQLASAHLCSHCSPLSSIPGVSLVPSDVHLFKSTSSPPFWSPISAASTLWHHFSRGMAGCLRAPPGLHSLTGLQLLWELLGCRPALRKLPVATLGAPALWSDGHSKCLPNSIFPSWFFLVYCDGNSNVC